MTLNRSSAPTDRDHLAADNKRLRDRLQSLGIDPDGPDGRSRGHTSEAAHLLREQQDFTRLLIDCLSEGFYAVGPDGLTTLCNAAARRMFGFADDVDLIGVSFHELVHHSHADGSHYPVETCPIYRAAREGISAFRTGEVFFRQDGSSFPVEYRAEPIVREGVLCGALCTFEDITDRLRAGRELVESRERLALAVDAAEIGIWDFSPSTGTLQWDDRVRAVFGLSPGKAITIQQNLDAILPADRPKVDRALAEAYDPAGSGDYAVTFRAIGIEDGRERWVAARGRATFVNGVVDRFVGAVRDVSDEKRAEQHLRLMVNELNHRVKNSLAMVQGVAAQTFRGTGDMVAARTAFTERLVALAKAHDVLTAANWEGADLGSVVALVAKSHAGDDEHRFLFEGPLVPLSPKAVLAMALALHELATNAVTYGALSAPSGTVRVGWRAVVEHGEKLLVVRWEERGGPPVTPPLRRGFGSKIIERGLAAELQGTVRIEFLEPGIVCTMTAPFPSP